MIVRLALLVVLLGCCASCDSGQGQATTVQTRLEAAVAAGETSFDFAAGSAFAWDYMYVFDCYSDRASVEKALGFAWPDFSKTSIESSDSVVLVVFVQNGKVVGWYEQPRTIELGYLANDQGYARSEAVFDVDRTNDRVALRPLIDASDPATE